ncbi:M16 family metallopeptidase [Neisseria wadsworthii]|uniref:M16 family peptidase n=1 Tax=Neisseria wadsworthii 9715 TaxID=1030841 RepID=G4CMF0_9NEIS|nr:pitrilysin family protein [Neisseria wadsworthii]EGZ51096.1 M16 family peptidase [Neisseria wadsworthii 9715]QMT36295.1 insulinase family protein [Neisseria wadsworthii]
MLRRTALILLLAATLPAAAETLKHTLPNGMKVIIKEDRRAPVAVSRLWYKVGSLDEQPGKTGLSHALEHMMFKGTAKVPAGEFSRRVAALGGRDNAYTSQENTVYVTDLAVKNLPQVLEMEADRMANLNFSNKDFDNEMKVIREERRMRSEDDPSGKLWEHLMLNAYENPAVRAPVIGYMPDLDKLKAEDLRSWYRSWYAPNNATLVIVGDVNAKQTLGTVEKLFGAIPQRTLPQRNNLQEPLERKPKSAQTQAITAEPMFILSYRVPALKQLDDTMPYALDVLSEVLGGNSSSRLDKNLMRGSQKAADIGVGYNMFSRTPSSLFMVKAMPSSGTSVQELVAEIRREIADIAAKGVSKAELARVRTQMEASEIYSKDSMDAQAGLIGSLEANGFSYQDEAELRRRLAKVSAQDVQAAAKLLSPARETLMVVTPEKESTK